jgi:serine/threonine protein kinase
VKLCDFGFAKLCVDRKGAPEDRSSTFCGTAAYVAPELIRNERYEPKAADIWSLGVLLYYMIAGKLPFGETAMHVFSAQEKVPPTFRHKFVMLRHSAHLDQLTECDALLRALLNKDAARRPTIA